MKKNKKNKSAAPAAQERTEPKVTLPFALTKDCTSKDLKGWLKIVYEDREALLEQQQNILRRIAELETENKILKQNQCKCGGSCGCSK